MIKILGCETGSKGSCIADSLAQRSVLFQGKASGDSAPTKVLTELQLVHLIFVLRFRNERTDGSRDTEQPIPSRPEFARQTHGFALIELATLQAHSAAGATTVSTGERQGITLLFKAVQDVFPLWHVMGDGAIFLPPVNGDSVAGAHPDSVETPCYILTCPT